MLFSKCFEPLAERFTAVCFIQSDLQQARRLFKHFKRSHAREKIRTTVDCELFGELNDSLWLQGLLGLVPVHLSRFSSVRPHLVCHCRGCS